MDWYVARCPFGMEERCIDGLKEALQKTKKEGVIIDYVVPPRKKDNPDKTTRASKNTLASYVFIKSESKEELINIMAKVEAISLMLDSDLEPIITLEEEIEKMRSKIKMSQIDEDKLVIGQEIKVLEAPFNGFVGTIDELDEKKNLLKVSVMILGRPVALELPFNAVERITE